MFNVMDTGHPSSNTVFDLSDQSNFAENYVKCVEAIRKLMKDETDVKFTFVMPEGKEVIVPVTPAEDTSEKGIYVIRLEYGDKSVDLVADKHQSWFRGIVTSSGHRFEIDEKLPKVMKNSKLLHTSGIYPELIECNLSELIIGFQQFHSAFQTLATFEGEAKELTKVKEAIAILLVMFFEGPRLLSVEGLTEESLRQFSFAEVGVKNQASIRNWCDDRMLFYREVAGARKIVISDGTSNIIRNAAITFRILCRSKWDLWVSEQEQEAQAIQKGGSKKVRGETSKAGAKSK